MEAPPLAGPALDRRFAGVALAAIPVLWTLVLWLSVTTSPVMGWALGLVAWWTVMGGALLRWADPDWLAEWLAARSSGRLVTLCLAVPVLLLGAATLRLLGQDPLPGILIVAAAIAAVVSATLEELFWRGAMIPEPTPGSAALSLGLFVLAQAVWMGARGLETDGPAWSVAAAALAMGGVWTASRLLSGTLGAGILSHAGLNLFAFTQVLALNT